MYLLVSCSFFCSGAKGFDTGFGTIRMWIGKPALQKSYQLVHVRDLHATMLYCLGIDHERFTYPFLGLDARLTGVDPARVVTEILS